MSETAVAGGEDRISALPLDVRLRLLSRLPADEAVRSSLLSRKWRGLWRKLPSLRLVASKVFKSSDPKGFHKFVNHLLLLRGHLPLEKCEIWAYCVVDEVDLYPYANLWIQYALICKVRMLDVIVDRDIHDLKLTVSLASEHLTTLNLYCVDLELCSALVDSQLHLDFSSCPLLVDLKMVCCNVEVHKISSESLKRLRATNCTFAGCGASRTRIYAPSLVSLYLSDFILVTPVLESMPLLQSAFLRLSDSCGDTCGVTDPGVQNCGNQSCEGCHGYPAGEYQNALLNGLSDAIHLELIAGSKVVSIQLPPSISTLIVVC